MPSQSLARRLSEAYPGASFASVSIAEFDSHERLELALGMLKEIGLEVEALPTGYYLFFKGRLRAWYPELPPEARSAAGGAAALQGLVGLLLGRRLVDAALDAWDGYDQMCGAPAFSFFKEVIEEQRRRQGPKREKKQKERQREVFDQALSEAYAVLEVASSATDAEVKSAYVELVKRHHPDRGGDETKMKEVNNARDLIAAHRGDRGATGASGYAPWQQGDDGDARRTKSSSRR